MNRTFITKSSGRSASAFQVMTPTIDFSEKQFSKLTKFKTAKPEVTVISEEELLQNLWQF